MDVGARLVGLLERAPAAMASAAAALAARVLNRMETKTPPWPEALRVESPAALPTQVRKRCQAALLQCCGCLAGSGLLGGMRSTLGCAIVQREAFAVAW